MNPDLPDSQQKRKGNLEGMGLPSSLELVTLRAHCLVNACGETERGTLTSLTLRGDLRGTEPQGLALAMQPPAAQALPLNNEGLGPRFPLPDREGPIKGGQAVVLRAKNGVVWIPTPACALSSQELSPKHWVSLVPGGVSAKSKWWVRQDSCFAARLSPFSGSLESGQSCGASHPDVWGASSKVTRTGSH